MTLDPVVAVWVGLALNAAGVLMMIGAKRQQISDLVKRMNDNEDSLDRIEREKLAVTDYHREQTVVHSKFTDVEQRAVRDYEKLDGRCNRIETRLDGYGGRR